MTHQLIKLVSAFFFSVMAISAVQGQNASQSDREYWVHTLLKIADPVLSNGTNNSRNSTMVRIGAR